MEGDRFPAGVRRRILRILELDSEDLQEVGGESSDDDLTIDRGYAGASTSTGPAFSTRLTSLHSYLGEVEDTHHRFAFLDGGSVLNLPLFYLEGVVLFPGAILPLRVVKPHISNIMQPNFMASIERALKQIDVPFTIGVIRVYRDFESGSARFASIGTTAEIRQFRRLEDGSLNVVTRGQHRFRLRRRWIDSEGAPCGDIQIIEEDLPLRTPRDAVGRLVPLRNLNAGFTAQRSPMSASQTKVNKSDDEDADPDVTSDESFASALSHPECDSEVQLGRYQLNAVRSPSVPDECMTETTGLDGEEVQQNQCPSRKVGLRKGVSGKLREVPRAFWPSWVYQMYDSYCLAEKAAGRWKQIVGAPNMDGLVRKPDLLSFQIASKIPLSESTRQELLEINGISYRLRREIELLESFDRIRCKSCQTLIARRSDMLVSVEGPLGAYVNPSGAVHEVMTLYKVNGLSLLGNPDKKFSWFPGYAWTIAECTECGNHIGWLYTATEKNLSPKSFWGISSCQVEDDAC